MQPLCRRIYLLLRDHKWIRLRGMCTQEHKHASFIALNFLPHLKPCPLSVRKALQYLHVTQCDSQTDAIFKYWNIHSRGLGFRWTKQSLFFDRLISNRWLRPVTLWSGMSSMQEWLVNQPSTETSLLDHHSVHRNEWFSSHCLWLDILKVYYFLWNITSTSHTAQ